MGCHTWFYKPLKVQPTYKEVQKLVIDRYNNLGFYERLISGELTESDKTLIKYYPNYNDIEFAKKAISLNNRKVRMISKGLCKVATCVRYALYSGNGIRYIASLDKFYTYKGNPHDVFRCRNYSAPNLSSYRDAENFYLDESNNCFAINPDSYEYIKAGSDSVIDNLVLTKLKSFFEKNPNGLITFG